MPGATTTRRAIRRRMYDEIPQLGFNGTADSVAVGSIVDTYVFQDSNLSTDQFRGAYIYRPDRTGDDIIKKAGALTLASGTLAHTGSNYSNMTDLNYEIVGLLHPDELNACITRAMRMVYFQTQGPLTLLTDDGDMGRSDANFWDGTSGGSSVSSATVVKTTTGVTQVFSGIRGLSVTATAGGGYTQSARVAVSRGDPVYAATIIRADTGTATVHLWDVTNNASIRSYSTTQENWVHIWFHEAVPSTCEEVAIRIVLTATSDVAYVDNVIIMPTNFSRFYAYSWLTEPFKFLKLRQAEYRRSLADHVDDARSLMHRDWYQPREYELEFFHPEANAYVIQLNRTAPAADLWIEGYRPHFDLEPLSNDTDTTTAPEDVAVAYSKRELAILLSKRYPTEPQWKELLSTSVSDVSAQTLSRPPNPDQPRRVRMGGRI